MNHREAGDLCRHVEPGRAPFEVILVLDEHLGFTDALVRCRYCDTSESPSGGMYLLTMIDWQGPVRAFRTGTPDPTAAARFLKDLDNGSCDIRRAGEQARHFRLTTGLGRSIIALDTSAGAIVVARVSFPEDVVLPVGSWRDLPCDGSWINTVEGLAGVSGNGGQARS